MGILYKRFGHLRLLRSSNVEEYPGQKSSRRSCRVVYANIGGQHKNLSDLSLNSRGGYVVICSEILVSSRRHITKHMVLGFGRPMQLTQGWGWSGSKGLYMALIAFRHIGCEIMSVDVVIVARICSSSHNLYVFGVYRNPDLSDKIITVCWPLWLRCSPRIKRRFFVFWLR